MMFTKQQHIHHLSAFLLALCFCASLTFVAPSVSAESGQQKLPKINIWVNKNETRKLLGVDQRINYVTDGNINTYPLGFTIPVGYNLSDMIFTWQNLGQSNVNYSISLVIGNIQAVEAPLINITRSGLIPKHEQVFKITLPCSGKVTDEVDVQVLINILGQVEEEPSSSSSMLAASSGEQHAPALGDRAEQTDSRLISHTLAIKRKKICTAHPMPVHPHPHPRPPTQPVLPAATPTPVATNEPANRWPVTPQAAAAAAASTPQHSPDYLEQPTLKPAVLNWPTPLRSDFLSPQPHGPANEIDAPLELAPKASLAHLHLHHQQQQQQQQQPLGRGPLPNLLGAPPNYPNWPIQVTAGLPPGNPLNELLLPAAKPAANAAPARGALLSVLMALALLLVGLIVATLVLLLAGAAHRSTPIDKLTALTSCLLFRTPATRKQNKCKAPMVGQAVLGSLRLSSAKTQGAADQLNSRGSSLSGLSGSAVFASGASQKSAYCYKSNCALGYYSAYQQQHQQHYQHTPTADLLGTGYQACANQQQQQQHYPIYTITGNNSQTTRLIWNNGNGTSPDGFTIEGGSYMPLSNAPRSDHSGSAYQTIY